MFCTLLAAGDKDQPKSIISGRLVATTLEKVVIILEQLVSDKTHGWVLFVTTGSRAEAWAESQQGEDVYTSLRALLGKQAVSN